MKLRLRNKLNKQQDTRSVLGVYSVQCFFVNYPNDFPVVKLCFCTGIIGEIPTSKSVLKITVVCGECYPVRTGHTLFFFYENLFI